jgi:hypothetical protein
MPWNLERNYSRLRRERVVAFWNDEAYTAAREALRRKQVESWTEDRRDADRERMRLRYADPTKRAEQGAPSREAWQTGTTKNHKVARIRPLAGDHDVYCLTVPEAGNFALEAGVFVRNCGIIVNVTPLEPTWEGFLTLEISNTTPLPAKIYGGEGIAQLLFFEGDEEPAVAYADRQGKYQHQTGVTLPRL